MENQPTQNQPIPSAIDIAGADVTPERIDFGPGVFGLDLLKQDGMYLAEVHSNQIGNSPTCLYSEGDKTYEVEDVDIDGEKVTGEYEIYELDLRTIGNFSIEALKDEMTLKKLIQSNKGSIKVRKLRNGESHFIPKGILHQARGKGLLKIWVPSGYENKKMIEADGIALSDHYQKAA